MFTATLLASHLRHPAPRSLLQSAAGLLRRRDLTTFADKKRPDLFYHLVSGSTPTFALSFLSSPPSVSDSSTIIGWVPALSQTLVEPPVALHGFRENPRFRDSLHTAIKQGLREGVDEIQINGAVQLQHGWMHIHDDRNIPPLGRIGDSDDILATVLVQDSKILTETYQPMPSYRICTLHGLTKLTPGLAISLLAHLHKVAQSECLRDDIGR